MIYVCSCCHQKSSVSDWERYTQSVDPDCFIPFEALGWEHSTFYCPLCHEDNAGYDLKTVDQFYGLRSYNIFWKDGNVSRGLEGLNFADMLKRAGIRDISGIHYYKEV